MFVGRYKKTVNVELLFLLAIISLLHVPPLLAVYVSVADDVILAISNSGAVKVWTITGNESKVSKQQSVLYNNDVPAIDNILWQLCDKEHPPDILVQLLENISLVSLSFYKNTPLECLSAIKILL